MRSRTLFVLLVLVLLAAFAWLNWGAFTSRKSLELLVARVDAPLGLLLLGVIAALTALYALFALGVETAALREGKRYARELLAQRKLAEEAEASRYTELRRYLEGELTGLRALPAEAAREVIVRVDQAEERLKTEVERAGNTVAAYIGELEDRLIRGGQPGASPS